MYILYSKIIKALTLAKSIMDYTGTTPLNKERTKFDKLHKEIKAAVL